MKLFIIGLVFMTALNAQAAKPPVQSTVEQYINLALGLTEEQLNSTKGNWTCGHAISIRADEPLFETQGKTREEATTFAALKCIRRKCTQMPDIMANARGALGGVGNEELARIMRGLGHTQQEIDNALINRQNPNEAYLLETSTCRGGSDNLRAFAVDSCFMIPFECSKK